MLLGLLAWAAPAVAGEGPTVRSVSGAVAGGHTVYLPALLASAARPDDIMQQWAGSVGAFAVHGNFVYAAYGPRLAVLDASDVRSPRVLGVTEADFPNITTIRVMDSHAYVLSGRGYTVTVVDVTNPTRPWIVGDIPGCDPTDFDVGDGLAFVECNGGFAMWDMAEPRQPRLVATAADLDHEHEGVSIAFDRDRVYFSAPGDFYIYEVVDRNSLRQLAHVNAGRDSVVPIGDFLFTMDEMWDVRDVSHIARYPMPELCPEGVDAAAAWAATLFTVCGEYTEHSEWRMFSLKTWNVKDPVHPVLVGSLANLWENPGWSVAIAAVADRLYMGSEDGFGVYDVRDPSKPVIRGRFGPGLSASLVAAADGGVVIADNARQHIFLVDMEGPGAPVVKGWARLPAQAAAITVSGKYAFAAGTTYSAFSGSVPYATTYFAAYQLSAAQGMREVARVFGDHFAAEDMRAEGTTVYLTTWAGLEVIDVSDPAQPHEIGWLGHNGLMHFEHIGQYLYIGFRGNSVDEGGVVLVDVSDPRNPRPLLTLGLRYTSGVSRSGRFAYTSGWFEMITLEVSDPQRPQVLDRIKLGKLDYQILHRDDSAYLSGWTTDILDLSDAVHPRVVGQLNVASGSLAAAGHHVYAAAGGNGLYTLPDAPGALWLPPLPVER